MSPVVIAVVLMLVLLFLKVPVWMSVIAGTASYFFLNPAVSSMILAQRLASSVQGLTLLAVPFFVCAGIFMNASGVSKRIMDLCDLLTGHMWGGLAQVNVLLSTLMGGLSGSNLADAAMEAKLLVPPMEAKGMSKGFSSVVTSASAMITPIIPPGIAMILCGSLANVSIGKLFVSGIGVGILLCAGEMICVSVISHKRGYKPTRAKGEKLPQGEAWHIIRASILPMCLPVVIIGGVRLGAFTATEAGAVAVVYSVFLGLLYRELDMKKIIQGLKETVLSTAGIMLIIGSAAGVVVMGLEGINFIWYLKRISLLALAGYLSGAAVYILQNVLLGI